MNFLEAHDIVKRFAGGPELPMLLAMSGEPGKLEIFLRASAAREGRSLTLSTRPFGTLGQTLLTEPAANLTEVFVLLPWDFVAECNWRSGLPAGKPDIDAFEAQARGVATRLAARANARALYLAAPIPPVFADPSLNQRLAASIAAVAATVRAEPLPVSAFSLASYLTTGTPFASRSLDVVAAAIVSRAVASPEPQPAKVLVTDLDNVMWRGVIGEDGLDGIRYLSEGTGFRHFIYQTFLAKLKREGALLAAVSRNDAELANGPFRTGRMALGVDDFVVIVASYNAKSAQIREIARQLNLGLDAFVFVDDNPLELEEVARAIPEIQVARFPDTDDELAPFLDDVARRFARTTVTSEDAERTEMYRRRLEGMVPDAAAGADLTEFLTGLEMSLVIHDRSTGDRTRAVQLINKTNQFNLNGKRVTDEEVAEALAAGGRLITASLSDRTGSHGEIIACLVDAAGVVRSFVMSCRVFQRRAEFAFFAWLCGGEPTPRALEFAATPRNEPIQQFLGDEAFTGDEARGFTVDAAAFAKSHADDMRLFALTTPDQVTAGTEQ